MKRSFFFLCLTLLVFYVISCTEIFCDSTVKPGIELFLEKKTNAISGKKAGLITNITGVDRSLRSTIELLSSSPSVNLTVLFSPEHGLKGGMRGWGKDSWDEKIGIPVYNLNKGKV
jgi:uncharacterized protein YbbC (DUF1343 family)